MNPDQPAPVAPPRRTELPLTDHAPRPYDGPPRAEVLALRRQYLTPGLVTVAKGIGNGAPLGACVTRPEVAAVMARRVHFNTFGGNPVSATQGLATLDIKPPMCVTRDDADFLVDCLDEVLTAVTRNNP